MMRLEGRSVSRGIPCKANVVSRVADGEAVVVPIRSAANDRNSIYPFNQSGTRLWAMVEEGRSGAEMATFLQTEYGLSAEEARLDTEEFLGELAREGLIDLA